MLSRSWRYVFLIRTTGMTAVRISDAGSIVGIALNAILPGKDYEFGVDEQGDTSVNFKV